MALANVVSLLIVFKFRTVADTPTMRSSCTDSRIIFLGPFYCKAPR